MDSKRKGMTLPNKLTLIRIILIPIMIIVYYIEPLREYIFKFGDNSEFGLSWLYLILLIIFAAASITDFFDGKIARKYNLVTTFGKFLDPLADKMLVFSSMALLMLEYPAWYGKGLPYGPIIPLWVFVVMIIREFMVSGIRMLAASKGEVIAAGQLGKWKTFITMIAIIVLFLSQIHYVVLYVGQVLMYIACILTILSGIEYLWNSRKIVFESI